MLCTGIQALLKCCKAAFSRRPSLLVPNRRAQLPVGRRVEAAS